jgi:ABC-type amino acid transport substrate-binding protein
VIELTAKEKQWIKENPVVSFGYDPQWKPVGFMDENGDFQGISSGYLDLISERVGLEFKPYPNIKTWDESLKLVANKEVLFVPAVTFTEERTSFLDFTETHSSYAFVIVSRKDNAYIGGLDYLEDVKVAAPKSYYITGELEKLDINMNFTYHPGVKDCLESVAKGETDATVTNLAVVTHYLSYPEFENLKIAAPTSFANDKMRMGVAKGNPELVSILNKGLGTMTQLEKSTIIQKWVTVQYDHGVDMKKVLTIAGVIGGIVFIIFGAFFYYNRKMKKEIVLRHEAQIALNESFKEIQNQKVVIEEKNEDVMASIIYAQRLQNAILPTVTQIKSALNNSFVLFMPKDIVSGDFYFLETKHDNNLVFFSSADCTGHGVPGAMVSLVCANALHEAVIENDLNKPSEILDSAKFNLEQRFARSGENIKDGMDISFCSLNLVKKEIQWAGANNPIWIVRDNNKIEKTENLIDNFSSEKLPKLTRSDNFHLIEITANRQPVGKFDYYKPFTNHTIQLCDGDTLYLSSDGYADQFGGENGKKMKSLNLKKLLLNIQSKSMLEQHNILVNKFNSWKGDIEQVDDVCIFGVKI